MNAPIRSVDDLVAAIRSGQIERELSDERFEDIAGLPKGSASKYLGPKKVKGLGQISLPLMLGALGKALVLVDDPEQIERVEGRWIKRKVVGGSAIQLKAIEALSMPLSSSAGETCEPEQTRKQRMQELGRKGGKRRLQTMSKRARQRIATHAARIRWAKTRKS